MDLRKAVVISPDVIEQAAASAVAWLPRSDNPQFVKGAIAAYAWVLGRLPYGPVSRADGPATVEALRREDRLADDAIYGPVGDPPVDQRFAAGVQNALMWLRGLDDEPPISIDR